MSGNNKGGYNGGMDFGDWPFRMLITQGQLLGAINTSTSVGATEATLQLVLSQLQSMKDFEETVWFDRTNTSLWYIRRVVFNEQTQSYVISFTDISGAPATPTIANLVQANSSSGYETVTYSYKAIANGTGYAIGDYIQELQIINSSFVVVATIWFNRTQNSILSPAPTFANLSPIQDSKYAMLQDGMGNNITSTGNALDVNIKTSGAGLALDSSLATINANLTTLLSCICATGNNTVSSASITGSGSTAAGTYFSVTFFNPMTNSADVTINGVPLSPGSSKSYVANNNKTLGAISYVCGGLTIYVEYLS